MFTGDFLEQMILDGAAEVAGIDQDTGEFLYSFTPKIAELYPEYYAGMLEYYHSGVINLWSKGFLDIDMESSDPIVLINDSAFDEKELEKLSSQEKRMLDSVIAQFKDAQK